MRGDILDALAVDPDLAAIANTFEILGAGVRARTPRRLSGHDVPSSSLAFVSHSATNRKTFSFGGCGEKVSSQRTGSVLLLTNVWTQPTLVHRTSPARAR